MIEAYGEPITSLADSTSPKPNLAKCVRRQANRLGRETELGGRADEQISARLIVCVGNCQRAFLREGSALRYAVAVKRLRNQLNRPKAPRTEPNRGSAAGNGVAAIETLSSATPNAPDWWCLEYSGKSENCTGRIGRKVEICWPANSLR